MRQKVHRIVATQDARQRVEAAGAIGTTGTNGSRMVDRGVKLATTSKGRAATPATELRAGASGGGAAGGGRWWVASFFGGEKGRAARRGPVVGKWWFDKGGLRWDVKDGCGSDSLILVSSRTRNCCHLFVAQPLF